MIVGSQELEHVTDQWVVPGRRGYYVIEAQVSKPCEDEDHGDCGGDQQMVAFQTECHQSRAHFQMGNVCLSSISTRMLQAFNGMLTVKYHLRNVTFEICNRTV